ncbi:MAG: response regulator [Deltaproteobacteria bacterium]|nr:response regulator [Deltaproteobacteria bacterium]
MAREDARILVVDDDRGLADMLVEYLSKFGYRAAAAYGGHEGLKRFKDDGFQIVIADLKMPDMDGMELMEKVKAIDRHVMVLVITGYGTIDAAVKAIKAGAYDFISKPLEFKALEVIIERALEHHTLFRRLGMFRGLTLALIVSVPLWLILGIVLAKLIK